MTHQSCANARPAFNLTVGLGAALLASDEILLSVPADVRDEPRRVVHSWLPQGGPRQINAGMWNWKAIEVVNAHVRRRADLMESKRIGLELSAHGLLALGTLVTHRYGLDEVDLAYGALEARPQGFLKAVVNP